MPDDRAGGMWQRDGARASERRRNPLPEGNPSGAPLKAVVKKQAGGSIRSTARVEKLPPGVYRVTARVVDDTRIPGEAFPWVLKDPDRLREERRAWTLQVTGPSASVPVPTPGPSGDPPPGK